MRQQERGAAKSNELPTKDILLTKTSIKKEMKKRKKEKTPQAHAHTPVPSTPGAAGDPAPHQALSHFRSSTLSLALVTPPSHSYS